MTSVVDTCWTTYLGYPLELREDRIRVYTPGYRWLGDTASMSIARRKVRDHRRRERSNP